MRTVTVNYNPNNINIKTSIDIWRGGGKAHYYLDPTPASLRRVCRLLQGQRAFGETPIVGYHDVEEYYKEESEPEQVCEWDAEYIDGVTEPEYLSALIVGCSGYRYTEFEMRADYCPHCGRKIKIMK